MKILIIGGGNMGLTYAQSFLRSHIASKEDMMILEKSPEKAALIAQKDIGTVYGDPKDCLCIVLTSSSWLSNLRIQPNCSAVWHQ